VKICSISPWYDPACASELRASAINKLPGQECRNMIGDITRFPAGQQFNEEVDIWLTRDLRDNPKKLDEVNEILYQADVLHFNQYDWNVTWDSMGLYGTGAPNINWKDFIYGKKVVWHGHGGPWLLDPEKQLKVCREIGAVAVTCSPIDEKVAPGVQWMPNVVGMDRGLLIPMERDWSGTLIGGMASHAGDYKGKVPAEYVFEYVGKAGYPVKFEFISKLSRKEGVLKRKNHHITVDNWIQGFFGLAGLEGLALGHIVIARMDPMARDKWDTMFKYDPVPIIDVKGMDECGRVLRDMCNDRGLAKRIGDRSAQWMTNNYTDKQIAEKWIKFYEGLPTTSKAGSGQKVFVSNFRESSPSPEHKVQEKEADKEAEMVQEVEVVEISNLPLLPDKKVIEKKYTLPEGDPVWQGFDSSGNIPRTLDSLMGNADYNSFELEKLQELFSTQLTFKERGRVLDGGCGIGRNVSLLEKAGFREIVGVDFSKWMCAQFKKNYPKYPIYNIGLEALTNFPPQCFDAAFIMYVFIHIVNDNKLNQVIKALEHSVKNEIVIGQVMDPELKVSTNMCKIREVYDLIKRFDKFSLKHFYKDCYSIKSSDGSATWKVSFLVMERGK